MVRAALLPRLPFVAAALAVLPSTASPQEGALPITHELLRSDSTRIVTFSGAVRGGSTFERRFADSLRFVLEPYLEGNWTIRVFSADSSELAGIVTPPFHGPNPLYIMARHFRNADNTGPNNGEVNAPGLDRDFQFLVSGAQVETARSAVASYTFAATQAARDSALATWDRLPKGDGRVLIQSIEIGGTGAGNTPTIDAMTFDVQLTLPKRIARR